MSSRRGKRFERNLLSTWTVRRLFGRAGSLPRSAGTSEITPLNKFEFLLDDAPPIRSRRIASRARGGMPCTWFRPSSPDARHVKTVVSKIAVLDCSAWGMGTPAEQPHQRLPNGTGGSIWWAPKGPTVWRRDRDNALAAGPGCHTDGPHAWLVPAGVSSV
jgi:hypothetical protein